MVKIGIVLGHKILKKGIEVDRYNIKWLQSYLYFFGEMMRSFLGHVVFQRKFIKYFSKFANPLCKLLGKKVKFEWNMQCLKAFICLIEKLVEAPIMIASDWSTTYEIICDASRVALHVVLQKKKEKLYHLIYFSSKALNGNPKNYTVTEMDPLTMVYAFQSLEHTCWELKQ